MALSREDQEAIIGFVKSEPRTINEVAHHIGRSWVTAERYVRQIADETGMLSLKVFREGTRGALKLAFYNHADRPLRDALEKELYARIRTARGKDGFAFFDVFQWAAMDKKDASVEPLSASKAAIGLASDLERCARQLLVFSGNLSVLSVRAGEERIGDVVARLVERGVTVRILARVSLGGLANLSPVLELAKKYPGRIEVRHAEQPLRGFLIDGTLARFTDEERESTYRTGELSGDLRITYEVRDEAWVHWLERVFWNLYRPAIDAERRRGELDRLA